MTTQAEFTRWFRGVTRFERDPYPYQIRFASANTLHAVVSVPTGLGKTATAVLGWVWRRGFAGENVRAQTPRRLVYCLPRRVLVEQTRDKTVEWLGRLAERFGNVANIAVCTLMGGEDESDWDLYPEREAIIVGTQDMLLSRALNRGYAMSRARWPTHFGLLNNDCLWVFDEVQLMGPGLATTAQLEAFRAAFWSKDGRLCRSVWMSATLRPNWLRTVDFDPAKLGSPLDLDEEDFENQDLKQLWTATKPLKKERAAIGDVAGLAKDIIKAHRPGTRTIVILNTVRRACELMDALGKSVDVPGGKRQRGPSRDKHDTTTPASARPKCVLLHSRFRPEDRCRAINAALADPPPPEGTIVVSTQVIEAGVDVSATILFTELAPWASLVQRFGRCNRRGEANEHATVYWMELPGPDADSKDALPYELEELKKSAELLTGLRDVGLQSLRDIEFPLFSHTHVIRRKDLIDLFDTTPDLAGNDIDIDRFVRDAEATDVRVFWRDWSQPNGNEPPLESEPAPHRQELCPAGIAEFRDFVQDQALTGKVWRWDFLEGQWRRVNPREIVPGKVFLIHSTAGGYDAARGWNAAACERVEPVLELTQNTTPPDAADADTVSRIEVWQTIAQHTEQVCGELGAILNTLQEQDCITALKLAARWHDRGKAHEIFQNAVDDGQEILRNGKTLRRLERPHDWCGCRFVAKAPGRGKGPLGVFKDGGFWRRYKRKNFRHELASALAVLDPHNMQVPDDIRDLVAYLVAAHHGKVRLSIRSMPLEKRPQKGLRFARGIWDGDKLWETDLGSGVTAPPVTLSLEPMELGICQDEPFAGLPSWAERMMRLRDSVGPFRLAYLEAILRAADMRASRAAEERAEPERKVASHV